MKIEEKQDKKEYGGKEEEKIMEIEEKQDKKNKNIEENLRN